MSYCGAPIKNPVVRPCVLNQSRAFEDARELAPLSDADLAVLHALEERVPDTVRDLVQRCGVPADAVSRALRQLYRHGRIRMVGTGNQVRPVVVRH
jgi:predicted transcriptional regulator